VEKDGRRMMKEKIVRARKSIAERDSVLLMSKRWLKKWSRGRQGFNHLVWRSLDIVLVGNVFRDKRTQLSEFGIAFHATNCVGQRIDETGALVSIIFKGSVGLREFGRGTNMFFLIVTKLNFYGNFPTRPQMHLMFTV